MAADLHRFACAACAVAGAMAALAACNRAPDQQQSDKPVLIGPENLATAKHTLLRSGPRISGTLEARERAVITAEVSGSVSAAPTEIGNAVERGEVLARIERGGLAESYRSAQAAVKSAQTALVVAQQQAERTASLVKSGARAQRDLEVDQSAAAAAAAQVEEARARVATAAQQLRDATVRSPLRGLVAQKNVREGDVVTVGQPLFTLIDPSSLRLEANVPADYLALLAVGRPVEFTVRGRPGKTFIGHISAVAPAADPSTRQIEILVSIPNPTQELVTGLFAEGRIVAERREALALPLDAVTHAAGSAHVLVFRNGKAEQAQVKLGIVDDEQQRVEIVSGVRAGDRVITGPARSIAPGSKVELLPGPAPGGAPDAGAADERGLQQPPEAGDARGRAAGAAAEPR